MRLSLPLNTARWPRETRDTLFLLAVIAWVVAMQTPYIPVWCAFMTYGVLLWRGRLAWLNRPLPAWPWRLALLTAAVVATWYSHRTLLGQDAGVTLIVVLLALKTLELRARRDAFVVFFLGFFTLLTHFFHSQSLLTALGILLALLGLLTALVLAHMPVGRPSLWLPMRYAGGMAMLGAPIMLILFMFFPRFAPLWGIPSDSTLGRSGLSGQMVVGEIARLALDDSIAFRVEFEGGERPSQQQLYFRGPVLSRFDGREWRPRFTPAEAAPSRPPLLETFGEPLRYRITLEPSNRPWVLALEATPAPPVVIGQNTYTTPDLQWLVRRPLTDVTRYEAEAWPRYRLGTLERRLALQPYVELPSGFNPRTLQWAQELQFEQGYAKEPQVYIDAALQRLREGGYRYTLEPGFFGQHTADEFWFDRKEGFCEHIASSFVVLMRALDIPARVVTGYHGGERNPVDGFWTVRQSDAHAWAEVWLAGQGWTRIDPTAYVSPARTTDLERLRPPPGVFAGAIVRLNPTLLVQMRALWEATNNRWNQWVLNYTQSRQLDLLKRMGFAAPSWTDLVHVLVGALVTVSLAGAAWAWWGRTRRDPWLRLLDQARRKLEKQGLMPPPNATPRQLAAVLSRRTNAAPGLVTAATQAWIDWLMALEQQRYDPNSSATVRELAVTLHRLPSP